MKDRSRTPRTEEFGLPRRLAAAAMAALAAALLVSLAVASLVQASGVGSPARTDGVIMQVITNPHIIESSGYLHHEGTTLYYSDGMGNSAQDFWLAGGAQGDGLDRVECTAAFGESPDPDTSPEDGWECGAYTVRSTNDGDGDITCTLYDDMGGSDSQVFTYTEDLLSPDSAASSPAYTNSLPIAVGWTASDTASGPAETCLWVRFDGGWSDASLCRTGTAGTYDYTPPGAQDGTYYFQTVSVDNVGNGESAASGDGDTATVLDRVDPVATVVAPATTEQLSWQVQWSATDVSGSGIDVFNVYYQVDGGGSVLWLESTTSTSATFGPSNPVPVHGGHDYSFWVRAYDRAGNHGDSSVVTTSVEAKSLYIPVALRGYAPLTNGGFEDAWSGWTHGGQLAQSISMEDTHSGTYAALLGSPAYDCYGGVPLGSAWLERTITIPSSGASTLRIWYDIWSQDKLKDDEFDRFEIWVNGSLAWRDGKTTDASCEPAVPLGWRYYDVDLSTVTGPNIILRLQNWNWANQPTSPDHDWFNTYTYVDDIEFLP